MAVFSGLLRHLKCIILQPRKIVCKLTKQLWFFLTLWISEFCDCTDFCLINIDLSANTVWPQASAFQKLVKLTNFGIYYELLSTQIKSKYKGSSLRSHCWMRLFRWFSNTANWLFLIHQKWHKNEAKRHLWWQADFAVIAMQIRQ